MADMRREKEEGTVLCAMEFLEFEARSFRGKEQQENGEKEDCDERMFPSG